MAKKETLKVEELDEDNGEEELTPEEEKFLEKTESYFEEIWKEMKEIAKDLSKKELAKQIFVLGVLRHKHLMEQEMEDSFQFLKDNPEEVKKMEEAMKSDSFWSKGAFAETISSEEMKRKEKTIHLKHDEDMNYNCKECNDKISAHNRDWHGGMCDACFDKNCDDADEDEDVDEENEFI